MATNNTIVVTTDRIPAPWLRAMNRAEAEQVTAYQITDVLYGVVSTSHPDTMHLIRLHESGPRQGKIASCDCIGWEHGKVCKHAGATARKVLAERGITVAPMKERKPVILPRPASRGKSQLFKDEEVA